MSSLSTFLKNLKNNFSKVRPLASETKDDDSPKSFSIALESDEVSFYVYKSELHVEKKTHTICRKVWKEGGKIVICCSDPRLAQHYYHYVLGIAHVPNDWAKRTEVMAYLQRAQEYDHIIYVNATELDETTLNQASRLSDQGAKVYLFCPRSRYTSMKTNRFNKINKKLINLFTRASRKSGANITL